MLFKNFIAVFIIKLGIFKIVISCDVLYCERMKQKMSCVNVPNEVTNEDCKAGFFEWKRTIQSEDVSDEQRIRLIKVHDNRTAEFPHCPYGLRPLMKYDVDLEKLSLKYAKECWGNERGVCRIRDGSGSTIDLAFFRAEAKVHAELKESPMEIEQALDFWTDKKDNYKSQLRFDCNHAPKSFGCGMIGKREKKDIPFTDPLLEEIQHIVCAYKH